MSDTKQVDVIKKAILPYEMFDCKTFDSLVMSYNRVNNILIGHNRYATRGKVNSTNAHPFQSGAITGVHNGTLTNQSLLPEHKHFDVDSENIIYSINKIGIEETFEKIHGSMSLVYWDEDENTLNLIRNEDRPLCMCSSQDGSTMYWASERMMLEWVLVRNKAEYADPVECVANTLYTFDIPLTNKRVACAENTIKGGNLTRRKFTPYLPPVVNYGNNYDYGNNYGYIDWRKNKNAAKKFRGGGQEEKEQGKRVSAGGLNGYKKGDIVEFNVISMVKDFPPKTGWRGRGLSLCANTTDVMVHGTGEAFNNKGVCIGDTVYKGKVNNITINTKVSEPCLLHIAVNSVEVVAVAEAEEVRIKAYRDSTMNKREYNSTTTQSCCWCDDILPFNQQPVIFITENAIICEGCQEHEDIKRYLH